MSELVNPEPGGGGGCGAFGSGGASGGAPGGGGGGSGAVIDPAGASGSQKAESFGRLAPCSRWRIATPASRQPGLSPMRGSLAAARCCCASPWMPIDTMAANTSNPNGARFMNEVLSERTEKKNYRKIWSPQ